MAGWSKQSVFFFFTNISGMIGEGWKAGMIIWIGEYEDLW
jgi:hypothetical protein